MTETLVRWITDLFWPRRCHRCGAWGTELCAGCRGSLVRSPAVRRVAGLTVLSAGTMDDANLAHAIWNLKYRSLPGLADSLAAWQADTVRRLPEAGSFLKPGTVLVPVPLHPLRLSERGYNQAALLADALASLLGLSTSEDVLVRIRSTSSQVQRASRAERLRNMAGAFAVVRPERVRWRDIVVVDDVSTTGATLTACATALKQAGARSVTGLVIARG